MGGESAHRATAGARQALLQHAPDALACRNAIRHAVTNINVIPQPGASHWANRVLVLASLGYFVSRAHLALGSPVKQALGCTEPPCIHSRIPTNECPNQEYAHSDQALATTPAPKGRKPQPSQQSQQKAPKTKPFASSPRRCSHRL